MHILIGLTYYRPHYSGLTIYTERLARSLVKLGHQVTVLTSRFNPELPEREVQDGVLVLRPQVFFHLSKGVVMPTMPMWAWRVLRTADVVNLHLPQMDASYIAWMARIMHKPVVMTYHCDLMLPKGTIHWIANQGAHLASAMTASAAQVIVTNSRDYAENSTFLRRYLGKTRIITPPVELPNISDQQIVDFRRRYQIKEGQRTIGMVARLASEKGVEYLIQALPEVLQKYPEARVLYVGQYQNVMGEEHYAQKLAPLIERLGDHWSFLGVLSPTDLVAFFHAVDVNVSPSLNATESFGMVQVEAMTCGTPAVASDLPGVRCPVQETGMGQIVPTRNAHALAQAIIDILDHPQQFAGDAAAVRQRYSSEAIASQYEAIFKELVKKP